MSKNKTLGRPRKEVKLPLGQFTTNDLIPLNPEITCRLTLYTRLKEKVKDRIVRDTGYVLAGKVGKPLTIYQRVSSYRASKARKAAAKARKLAGMVVDLTPASAPVAA
jgi:hypothetical protein